MVEFSFIIKAVLCEAATARSFVHKDIYVKEEALAS